jgi:hypothetical protein
LFVSESFPSLFSFLLFLPCSLLWPTNSSKIYLYSLDPRLPKAMLHHPSTPSRVAQTGSQGKNHSDVSVGSRHTFPSPYFQPLNFEMWDPWNHLCPQGFFMTLSPTLIYERGKPAEWES